MADQDKKRPAPPAASITLPAALAMGLTLEGGRELSKTLSDHFDAAVEHHPIIREATGTELADIATFSRNEILDMTEFAAKSGVTAKILASPGNGGTTHGYWPGSHSLEQVLDRVRPGSSEALAKGIGLAGPLGQEQIVIGRASVPLLMHEIGHAAPIMGSPRLRDTFGFLAAKASRSLPMQVGRGALMANALTVPGKDESGVRGFARDHAALMIGSTYVPELVEEARATIHALRGAAEYGPGVARVAKVLLPAFGGYAVAAATPVIATILAQRVMQAFRDRDGRPVKTAASAAPAKQVNSSGALRSSASAAWHMGGAAPRPKTSPPGKAKSMPTARPPSNRSYHADAVKSIANPSRGFRDAKPQVG